MSKPVADKHTIVCALDLTEAAPVVLERALDTAARHDTADIHVVSVIDDRGMLRHRKVAEDEVEAVQKQMRALITDLLASFGHPADDPKGWSVTLHVRLGAPSEEIVNLAWETRADVIVIGKHSGRSGQRYFLGAVPERVARLSTCPVMLVQAVDYEAEEQPPAPEPQKRESDRLPRTVYMIPYGRSPDKSEPRM
jgi:nucleotide-binding universal stress UspA family protein